MINQTITNSIFNNPFIVIEQLTFKFSSGMVVKNEANRVAWFGNGYGGKYHLMTNGMTGNTTDYTATLVTIFVQKDGFNSYRVICQRIWILTEDISFRINLVLELMDLLGIV